MSQTPLFSSADEAIHYIKQHKIKYLKIGLFDLNGVLRGKTISQQKFLSLLNKGGCFYDGILGGDLNDELTDNSIFTGAHTGYPDAKIEVIAQSGRKIPWEEKSLFFLCQYQAEHNTLCGRSLYQAAINKAAEMGFTVYSGTEYEFTVLAETDASVRESHYHNLQPFTLGNFGYSIQRSTVQNDLYQELLYMCEAMHMPLECLHTEIGPGMLEAALKMSHGVESSDQASLFKAFCKSLMERHGLLATFMAKWREDVQGHGMHVHLSILDSAGKNIFYDAKNSHHMSQTMQHFVAGQQLLMPELLVLCAPTINSYARYVPGCWAPTEATWGVNNRAVSLRVITGNEQNQRVEYRIPGADCNPYLAHTAALASGLYGIENKLTLGAAFDPANPKDNQAHPLPKSLEAATKLFSQSDIAKALLGEAFVADYAAARDWEVRQYQKSVTDWQLARYLETV